ncbi:glycosyltransferase family 4 protein [Flavobacterium sp.]|uniref:glycosyltransferase family 4 protein n=1 Tax=Flavobacterium sp. TaxID=239 RepID=UPI003753B0B8
MGIIHQKIAILCNYELLPQRVGGMDYFFWLFNEKCKEKNIEVHWFFPNIATHGNYKNFNLYASNHDNVENYFLEHHSQNQYSHIITHFVELCTPFFKNVKKNSNATIIAIDHNPRPLLGYSFKKKIEKKIKGFLYSKYINLFVGVSNYTVDEIIKDFGNHVKKKTITVYNGVIIDDIKVREIRDYDNPSFLVASHLRMSKGIQDLIDAVALLSPVLKNKITIAVYGDGPYKEILLEKVRLLGLEKNFTFEGSKSNLKEIFCNYDYMLQPTHMECFSLSILESLAANVPVITTNVGGNEEAIVNNTNGYIYKAKDYIALKNILEKILMHDLKITKNTRQLVEEKFSLSKMVDNHINLLQI